MKSIIHSQESRCCCLEWQDSAAVAGSLMERVSRLPIGASREQLYLPTPWEAERVLHPLGS